MKKNRILSLFFTVVMLLAVVLPTNAFSEEFVSQEVDSVVVQEGAEEPAEEAAPIEIPGVEESSDEPAEAELTGDEGTVADEEEPEAVTEEVDEAVSTEEAASEAEAQEEAPFESGYVTVKKGAPVYKTDSKKEELGAFKNDAVVYAVVKTLVEDDVENSWLWITYDTAEAKEAEEQLPVGYVQFKSVTVMTEEEVEELVVDLAKDDTVRDYRKNLLPEVEFVAKDVPTEEVAIDEEVVTEEPALATATFAITQQPQSVTAEIGDPVQFTVVASGVASYQWQYSRDGKTWYACGVSQGGKTDTLSTSANENRYTLQYRCVLTDNNGQEHPTNVVKMIKPGAFAITQQPEDVVAAIGEPVQFTVVANGAESYQWQYSRDGKNWYACGVSQGGKTDTLSTSANENRYTFQYRCVLTDNNGEEHPTNVVKMINPNAFEITQQPEDVVAAIGDPVQFTVVASGVASYQWQYSRDGKNWYACGVSQGGKTDTLSTSANENRYTFQYRCVLTDNNGEEHPTNVVKMINPNAFEITQQPEDVIAAIGEPVQFTVVAKGVASYQWQYSRDEVNWHNCGVSQGAQTDTLSTSANENRYTFQYRCVLTGADGTELITDLVKMINPNAFEITQQPEDVVAAIGEPVQFTVVAKGVASYQWQYSRDGVNWYACGASQGGKTDTLSTSANENRYTFQYRCVLTDNNGEEHPTNLVRMINPNAFAITQQPEDVVAAIGEPVQFTVVADGVVSYQWQYSRDEVNWHDCGVSQGAQTDTLSTSANENRYTFQYRCVLTGVDGTELITDLVKMINPNAFEITQQPEDVVAAIGEPVQFTVVANGAESYQWQYSRNGVNWYNCGESQGGKTDTLSTSANENRYTFQYRCVLTDKNGEEHFTDTVRMINPYIIIDEVTYEPIDETTCRILSYSGSAATLVIPDKVEGMDVIEVGKEAFMGNSTLVSIDLPDSILYIRERAFKNCSNLSEMK